MVEWCEFPHICIKLQVRCARAQKQGHRSQTITGCIMMVKAGMSYVLQRYRQSAAATPPRRRLRALLMMSLLLSMWSKQCRASCAYRFLLQWTIYRATSWRVFKRSVSCDLESPNSPHDFVHSSTSLKICYLYCGYASLTKSNSVLWKRQA